MKNLFLLMCMVIGFNLYSQTYKSDMVDVYFYSSNKGDDKTLDYLGTFKKDITISIDRADGVIYYFDVETLDIKDYEIKGSKYEKEENVTYFYCKGTETLFFYTDERIGIVYEETRDGVYYVFNISFLKKK